MDPVLRIHARLPMPWLLRLPTALLAACALAMAHAQAAPPPSGISSPLAQVPGACMAPPISPGDSHDQIDYRARAYLLCLQEQQRISRAIDDNLRRDYPTPAQRFGDPMQRRFGESTDSYRR